MLITSLFLFFGYISNSFLHILLQQLVFYVMLLFCWYIVLSCIIQIIQLNLAENYMTNLSSPSFQMLFYIRMSHSLATHP